MSVIVPIKQQNIPYFDLQAPLDGVTYTLVFRWNVRQNAWFLDVLSEDSTITYESGMRLCADWPMAANKIDRQPPGALFPVDTSGAGLDPGIDDLGTRVKLVYFSTAELNG